MEQTIYYKDRYLAASGYFFGLGCSFLRIKYKEEPQNEFLKFHYQQVRRLSLATFFSIAIIFGIGFLMRSYFLYFLFTALSIGSLYIVLSIIAGASALKGRKVRVL